MVQDKARSLVSGLLCTLLLLTIIPPASAEMVSEIHIVPVAPVNGSTYFSTPSYVLFDIDASVAISPEDVIVRIDNIVVGTVAHETNRFRTNITSPLPVGEHTVTVSVAGGMVVEEWTFVIDPSSENAPRLLLLSPAEGAVLEEPPTIITVRLVDSMPPSIEPQVRIFYEGEVLETFPSSDTYGDFWAAVPSGPLSSSILHIGGEIEVDGRYVLGGDWTCIFDQDSDDPVGDDDMTRAHHGSGYSILHPPNWTVEKNKVLAGSLFDLVIIGPQVDGTYQNVNVQSSMQEEVNFDTWYFIRYIEQTLAALSGQGIEVQRTGGVYINQLDNLDVAIWKLRLTGQGISQAQAMLADQTSGRVWIITCSTSEGSFNTMWPTFERIVKSLKVDAATGPEEQEYVRYVRANDYDVLVPAGWTTQEEYASEDSTFSLAMIGPRVNDFTINILLQNGTDSSLREDHDYLRDQIDDRFFPELEDQGIHAAMYEQPVFLTVSNHTAMVFSLLWTSSPIIQKAAIIVDEENHRYWIFTCTAAEDAYGNYSGIFDTVLGSFNVIDSEHGERNLFSGNFPVLIGSMVVMMVLASVVAAAILRRRERI